eukprot:TRINITY_DN398_c0_g1_i1.p1 TRINITY_DN398_c0_g1~~TRINITY_DN398_c0_g1_i1.p1  ORF type:complete len:295 (-),score=4.35 TRINITY_DN398_c0_g1_i1:1-885(-)
MKAVLFLTFLVLFVHCYDAYAYFYTNGIIKTNSGSFTGVSGPLYVVPEESLKFTAIAGMEVTGLSKIPFTFEGRITKVTRTEDRIEVEGDCVKAGWGVKEMEVAGTIKISALVDWSEVHYQGTCENTEEKLKWEVVADGKITMCPYYSPAKGGARAQLLVGESGYAYQAVNVLNYAILGYPYVSRVTSCEWYLKKIKTVTEVKPGYVIVGKDGAHCAIIDKEGDKFIHLNPVNKQSYAVERSLTILMHLCIDFCAIFINWLKSAQYNSMIFQICKSLLLACLYSALKLKSPSHL